jgi:hypothetical protein
VRRHIAHASRVLSTPVIIVKIPMTRLIFVSVEMFLGSRCGMCLDKAVVMSSVRLWLVYWQCFVYYLHISDVGWKFSS